MIVNLQIISGFSSVGTKITGKGRLQRKRGSEGTCATVSRTSRKPNGRGQAIFWKEMSKNSCVIQRKGENTRLRFLPLRGRVLKWKKKKNESSEGKDGEVMNTFHLQMEMI